MLINRRNQKIKSLLNKSFFEFATIALTSNIVAPKDDQEINHGAKVKFANSRYKNEYSDDLGVENAPKATTHHKLKKQLNNSDLLYGYCENEDQIEKISLGEFSSIEFDNRIPSFSVDLIRYLTGHNMYPKNEVKITSPSNFDIYDEKLSELKKQLGEADYDCLVRGFKLFYANPETLVDSQWYITRESINANLEKVFGEFSEYFSNQIFYFLSDGLELERIPLYNFIKNMNAFLSDEKIIIMGRVFQFYDSNHDGVISIVDLLQAQASVPCDTMISEEISSIIETYVNEVLLGRRRRVIFEINNSTFEMFLKTSCIATEIIDKVFKRSTKGWPEVSMKSILSRSMKYSEQE